MKIYSVYHCYDVDGEFGDAVPKEKLVAIFENKADAKAFVKKYHNPYVYYKPYDELYCNAYCIRETEIVAHKDFDINHGPEWYGIRMPR